MTAHDPRLAAFRPDLADERLKGEVEAERFVKPATAWVNGSVVDLLRRPGAGLDTQLVKGAKVSVFEEKDGWAWIQAEQDSYVGYLRADQLSAADPAATHVISVPRTFIYPGPDLRFPRAGELSMGAKVTIIGEAETRGTRYGLTSDGQAIIWTHLLPLNQPLADYVAIAETFENTPYLWGGVSGFGIDCSGLVQLAMHMTGVDVLRDTDQQERSIGVDIDAKGGLQRGDLVFWKGHVAIMTDLNNMVHANGHTMLVSYEPLDKAIERIGYLYGQPTRYRRP